MGHLETPSQRSSVKGLGFELAARPAIRATGVAGKNIYLCIDMHMDMHMHAHLSAARLPPEAIALLLHSGLARGLSHYASSLLHATTERAFNGDLLRIIGTL